MDDYQPSMEQIQTSYNRSFNAYEKLLEEGVAKEVARMVLPVATYSEFYATTNARALMNFLNLRGDATAQWEIRQYANGLEHFFQAAMPVTYAHFIENQRIAP